MTVLERKEWHHWRISRHMLRQVTHTHTQPGLWLLKSMLTAKENCLMTNSQGNSLSLTITSNSSAVKVKGSLSDKCDVTLLKCVFVIPFLVCLSNIYSRKKKGNRICLNSISRSKATCYGCLQYWTPACHQYLSPYSPLKLVTPSVLRL